MNKKFIITTAIALTVLGGSVAGYIALSNDNPTLSSVPISNFSEINNPEFEENTEAPTEGVAPEETQNNPETQSNANTTPTSSINDPSPAPSEALVETPAPVVAPEPAPVTILTAEKISVGGEDYDCSLTYSDGTSLTKQFIRVTYNQGYRTIATIGKCDSSLIGKNKVV